MSDAKRWPDFIVKAALIVLGVGFLLWSLQYAISPLPPFGYYYDLGVSIHATADVDASINSFLDLKDFIGWAGCDNAPQFVYAPLLTYVVLVPLARLLAHDAFAAIKVLQIIELAIAFGAMSWLYTVYARQRSMWAYVAGTIYALLPSVAPDVRGNVEFGLVSASLPAALAIGFLLLRRFGERALPLAGAIVAVLSSCIVAESLFFVTLPVYAILALSAIPNTRKRKWLLFVFAGVVAACAISAYYVVPTLASRALLSRPASSISILKGGEYSLFSQDWLGLLALVPREQTVNTVPLFNAASAIPFVVIPAALLWLAAVLYVVRGRKLRELTTQDRAVAGVGVACVLLALGANLPLIGNALWDVIAHVPVIGLIRTPDRFMLVAEASVTLFAMRYVEGCYRREYRSRFIVAGAFAAACIAFVTFDLLQHTLSLEPDWNQEPAIADVQRTLAHLGPKQLALTMIKDGPSLGYPYYGAGIPYDRFSPDLVSRYLDDGVEAVGIARRLGVQGIVATPNWSNDAPELPDFAAVIATSPHVRTAFTAAGAPTVFALDDRIAAANAARTVCLLGGPGLLDRLLAYARYANAAFVQNGSCTDTVRVDFDPRDAAPRQIVQISGNELFPSAQPVLDNDYPFTIGATYINDPWYRNSIDGSAPSISRYAAVKLDSDLRGTWRPTLATAGDIALNIHVACREFMQASIVVDAQTREFSCEPRQGFQWITVPLGRLGAGAHTFTFGGFPVAERAAPGSPDPWSVALDGVQLLPSAASVSLFAVSPADELFSLDRFSVVGMTAHKDASFSLVDSGSLGSRTRRWTYRWMGPPGRYRISAKAKRVDRSATVVISGNPAHVACCSASVPGNGLDNAVPIVVSADLTLRTGDIVAVATTTSAEHPTAFADVDVPEASMLDGELPPSESTGAESTQDVPVSNSGLSIHDGESVTYSVKFVPHASRAIARVSAPTAAGRATLSCDGRRTSDVLSGETALAIEGGSLRNCRISIQATGDTTLSRVKIVADRLQLPHLQSHLFVAAGSYTARVIRSNNVVDTAGKIRVDGKDVSHGIVIRRSGYHTFDVLHASGSSDVLALFLRHVVRHLAQVSVKQTAAARWLVDVPSHESVEAAVFPDGNWKLVAPDGTGIGGRRCDIANTCFDDVAAGRYLLVHNWPLSVKVGMLISVATLLGALLLLRLEKKV